MRFLGLRLPESIFGSSYSSRELDELVEWNEQELFLRVLLISVPNEAAASMVHSQPHGYYIAVGEARSSVFTVEATLSLWRASLFN